MIKVKLMGGLGNQMFQFCLAYSLAKRKNSTFVLDESVLQNELKINSNSVKRNFDLDVFAIDDSISQFRGTVVLKPNYFLRNINKLFPITWRFYFVERFFQFDRKVFEMRSSSLILEGYWQSYKYFLEYENEIKGIFKVKENIIDESMSLFEDISNSNSVCINVRRADFVSNSFHGVIGIQFYIDSVKIINSKFNIDKFYIFSDDIEWCKNNFDFIQNKVIVHHTHKGYKFGNYFELMRNCKHFIIPNSSFAWWAAWLADNPEKNVIAPQKWFSDSKINTKDLIPEDWIRI
jgi:hypothetical protein